MRFIPEKPIHLPATFSSKEEGERVVRDFEIAFDRRLEEAAEVICRDVVEHGVRVIRLSGPTCAGKTTTAAKLTEVLEAAGCSVHPISLDDFFYDREVLIEKAAKSPDKKLDYDSVETINLPAIAKVVNDLMTEGRAEIPVFDFMTGKSTDSRTLTVADEDQPVFLFEGIQAVYPEVAALFEGVEDRSLFISVFRDVTVVGEDFERTFEPNRIRLMRRLVRDEAKRGATPTFTLHIWHTVRENEENAIFPQVEHCDYLIDSAMGFDVHMLAPHLRRILEESPVTGEDEAIAADILASLAGVEGISDDCLADNSLYHEFILKDHAVANE